MSEPALVLQKFIGQIDFKKLKWNFTLTGCSKIYWLEPSHNLFPFNSLDTWEEESHLFDSVM